MVSKPQRAAIRRFYRMHRAAVDLTQAEVGALARRYYPEFGQRRYEVIENGVDYASPSERKALARVLKVRESEIPQEAAEAKAS